MREISDWGPLAPEEVQRRWRAETAMLGANVLEDVARFGVVPHQYDAAMERLYRESVGFIFETLCYWITPDRLAWSERAAAWLGRYCRERNLAPADLRILMLGDGAGSDTLLLTALGYRPSYFDVQGSRTSDFAAFRFARHGVRDRIRLCTDYGALLNGGHNVLWSFDVLEHLPDLPRAIRDMARMLGPGGAAIITESCCHVRPELPTHLAANVIYHGRIPALMRSAGLYLSDFAPSLRPTVYERLPRWAWRQRLQSRLRESQVLRLINA